MHVFIPSRLLKNKNRIALINGYVENSGECEMAWLRACVCLLMWRSCPSRMGDQQGSSAMWGALLLLHKKLQKGSLRILPELHFCTNIPTIWWWVCSSSPAPLIHMVLIAAVLPANTTWPAQERKSKILGYGAAWDCNACWFYITKRIIAFAYNSKPESSYNLFF